MNNGNLMLYDIIQKAKNNQINHAERSKTKIFTEKELEEMKKNDILWIAIDNKVYDVGCWMEKHPGGNLILAHFLYRDATDQFDRYHPKEVKENILPRIQIGVLEKPIMHDNEVMKEFRQIEEELIKEGFFNTNYYFYLLETIKGIISISIGILLVIYGNQTYFNYLIAAWCIAFCWHQLSFVAHDTGHNSVTHILNYDHYYGVFLASGFSGLSIGWWKDSHNIHHVVTNDPTHDPDIQHLPFLAVSEKFLSGINSTYHNKKFKIVGDVIAHFFVGFQHFLYYFIMMFGRINLYVQSVKYILINDRAKFRKTEFCAMIFFLAWFSYLLSYIPTIQQRIFFVILTNFSTFLLHVQITISHFAMNTDPLDENEDFVRHQLRTSMDIDCNEWLDWLHGGLQFQVAHHLFPRLPRHNLRKVRDRLLPFFKKHNLTYHCYDFKFGNKMVIDQLRTIASKLKDCLLEGKKIN